MKLLVVPTPLLALVALVLLMGVTWSLVTPAFQAPDENSHFGYVQELAEAGRLPGQAGKPLFSTEQVTGAVASNADQAAAQRQTRMEWDAQVYSQWQRVEHSLPKGARTDGGGPNPASSNPPLYYALEAGGYRLAEGGDLFDRLEAARLLSVGWLLVTVVGVWLLAGEAFGRDRMLQTIAAGAAGLAPMVQFVSASVTPDSMLYAMWSLVLWLGLKVVRRGLTWRRAAWLFALTGIACCVKATSFALLPGVALAVAVGLARSRRERRVPIVELAAAGIGFLATFGVWFVLAHILHRGATAQVSGATTTAGLNIRQALSYLWQYYLPRPPFLTPFPTVAPHIPVYDIWFKGVWGEFGWLEVQFSNWVYLVLGVVTVGFAAASLRTLWRMRRRIDRWAVAFLAVVAFTLLAALHWTDYRQIAGGGGNFIQGRYLLPLIGLAGLVCASAMQPLTARGRAIGGACFLGGLLVLDLASLGLMLERFYA